jgi:hypothetical protein
MRKPGCNGWSYHVFALAADKCSICGKTIEDIRAEEPLHVSHRASYVVPKHLHIPPKRLHRPRNTP